MSKHLNPTAPASVQVVDQIAVIHFFDGRELGDAPLIYSVVVSDRHTDHDLVVTEFARANWSAVHEDLPMPEFDADIEEQFYDMDGDGIYWKSERIPLTMAAAYTLMRSLPPF